MGGVSPGRQGMDSLPDELIRDAVKYCPNSIAVFDREMICLSCNDAFLRDYEVTEEQVIGICHYETFPELPQKWRDVHQRVLQGVAEKSDEDWFEWTDGSIYYTWWDCRPWYDDAGEIGGMILYSRVINESRKVGVALRDAKERAEKDKQQLEAVLASINSGVVALDANARPLHVNDALARILGYKDKSELSVELGFFEQSFCIYSYPDRVKLPLEEWPLQRVARGDTVGAYKCILKRLDSGEEQVIEFYGKQIRDEGGEIQFVLLIMTDVSEREEMLRELEQSDKMHRALLEVSPLALFIVRLSDASLLNVNEATCKMHGYTHDEMLKLTPSGYISETSRQSGAFDCFHQALCRGENYSLVSRDRRKDGTEFPVEVFATPVDYQGEKCALALVNDITERQRGEEALKTAKAEAEQQQAQLQVILDHVSNGVAVYDISAQPVYVNDTQARIFGFECANEAMISWELIADKFRIQTYPDRIDLKVEDWPARRVLSGEKLSGEIFYVQRLDIELECVVMLSGAPICDAAGNVTLAVIASNDITERVKRDEQDRLLQERMEQTQRLESLGVLAGGIAHDFNNLLMAIIGHADLALIDLPQLSPAAEDIEAIKTSSRRAADLCTQLLAYSGKGKLEETSVLHVGPG